MFLDPLKAIEKQTLREVDSKGSVQKVPLEITSSCPKGARLMRVGTKLYLGLAVVIRIIRAFFSLPFVFAWLTIMSTITLILQRRSVCTASPPFSTQCKSCIYQSAYSNSRQLLANRMVDTLCLFKGNIRKLHLLA